MKVYFSRHDVIFNEEIALSRVPAVLRRASPIIKSIVKSDEGMRAIVKPCTWENIRREKHERIPQTTTAASDIFMTHFISRRAF